MYVCLLIKFTIVTSFLFVFGDKVGAGITESVATLIISNWSASDSLGFSLLEDINNILELIINS